MASSVSTKKRPSRSVRTRSITLQSKTCYDELLESVPVPVVALVTNLRDTREGGAVWALYLTFYFKGESVISLNSNSLRSLNSEFFETFSWEKFSLFSAATNEYTIFRSMFTDRFVDGFEEILFPGATAEAEKGLLTVETKAKLHKDLFSLTQRAESLTVDPPMVGTDVLNAVRRETQEFFDLLESVRKVTRSHLERYDSAPFVYHSARRYPFFNGASLNSLDNWLKLTCLPITYNYRIICDVPSPSLLVRCSNDKCIIVKSIDAINMTWYQLLSKEDMRASFMNLFGGRSSLPGACTFDHHKSAPRHCLLCEEPWSPETATKFEETGVFEKWEKRTIYTRESFYPPPDSDNESYDDDDDDDDDDHPSV